MYTWILPTPMSTDIPGINSFVPYDMTAVVGKMRFKVSSHILSVVSDVWSKIIEEEKMFRDQQPGRLTITLDVDDNPMSFNAIMLVAYNRSYLLPSSFDLREMQQLANMCKKYDLACFFKQHTDIRTLIEESARQKMPIDMRMHVAWTFKLENIFKEVWSIVKDRIEVNNNGDVYLPSEDVEKLAACDNGRHTSFSLSKRLLPMEVLSAFKDFHWERREKMREADVYGFLINTMLSEETDADQLAWVPCDEFQEASWGRVMIKARAEGCITAKTPLKTCFRDDDENALPETTADWLKLWKEKLDFRSCGCHCEVKIWESAREACATAYDELPDELESHFAST